MMSHPPYQPSCTIIIATLALRERADSLNNAILSVKTGNESVPNVLVVVNGKQYDAMLVATLQTRSDIQLIQISTPSLSAAILAGRTAVATSFFGFLDDDDEYLPGSIDARLAVLAKHAGASLVTANGYRHVQGEDHPAMHCLANVSEDPLAALYQENWLASCGALFRTDDMPLAFFEEIPRYREWTWLAFRLSCAGKQVAILDMPCYRINDTIGSESKSDAYLLSQIRIYQQMLKDVCRPDIARIIRGRLSQSWHDVSNHHLNQGDLRAAWVAHLHSLSHSSGWKFFVYTRKLLPVLIKRNF
jgi:hypothetical protein